MDTLRLFAKRYMLITVSIGLIVATMIESAHEGQLVGTAILCGLFVAPIAIIGRRQVYAAITTRPAPMTARDFSLAASLSALLLLVWTVAHRDPFFGLLVGSIYLAAGLAFLRSNQPSTDKGGVTRD